MSLYHAISIELGDEENLLPALQIVEIIDTEENVIFHIYSDDQEILLEAKHRGDVHLGGIYSASEHQPHAGPEHTQYHLHIYAKGNQIAAMNRDGTGHDGYHGERLPNRARKGIGKLFPNYTIPDGGLLESATKVFPALEYYTEEMIGNCKRLYG